MPIKIDKKAISLLYRYFLRGDGDVHQIPYIPQKVRIIDSSSESPLPRAMPESKGVSSASLLGMLTRLERDSEVNLHSIAVLSDDSIICEASAPGYDACACAVTHSLCKTVTSLAIGMLVDDGRLSLSDRVYRLLGEGGDVTTGKMKKLTVRHLLTMSSGALFNEVGLATSLDWEKDFFEYGVDFDAGKKFAYNSMNSYMLSRVVRRVSGVSMSELLRTRLFDVLGVPDFVWEKCPGGVEKGGWGLYISMQTMLKLGTLFMNGGVYNGTRVVSEEWIKLMMTPHMEVGDDAGGYDYGLHMWVGRDNGACLLNGLFGQNVIVFPDRRIVVATTASNTEMFGKSRMLEIISDTFTSDDTYVTKKQTKVYKKLKKKQERFCLEHSWISPLSSHHPIRSLLLRLQGKSAYPLPEECDEVTGEIYEFEENNASVLPIFVSFMQNNFGDGLKSISFSREGDELYLTLCDSGEECRINVGFYAPRRSVIRVRGELYTVMAWAELSVDEDRHRLLKIEITFPEMTSVRRMKIFKEGNSLVVRLSEQPGYDVVGEYVSSMRVVAPKSDPLVSILAPAVKREYVTYKIKSHLEPVLHATLVKAGEHCPCTRQKKTRARKRRRSRV